MPSGYAGEYPDPGAIDALAPDPPLYVHYSSPSSGAQEGGCGVPVYLRTARSLAATSGGRGLMDARSKPQNRRARCTHPPVCRIGQSWFGPQYLGDLLPVRHFHANHFL